VTYRIEKKEDCPCPKVKCENHGFCDACREKHYSKGGLPYCEQI
jgi:hypothetical protein